MTGAPRTRFVHATKQSKHFFFVVVPKITSSNLPSGPDFVDRYCYNPGDKWAGGSAVIPVTVTSNGELARCPEFGRSCFDTVEDALEACGPFEALGRFDACFGAIMLDVMYFLVASKTEIAMELPFGPVAYRILETQWVAAPLPDVPKLHVSDRDHRRLKEFAQHSFHPGCYYSDEADLSLPFPFVSSGIVGGGGGTRQQAAKSHTTAFPPPPPPDFCGDWSHNLRKPFHAIALDAACSVMMSGFIAEHRLGLEDGQLLRLQLIGHKNHRNPGPRYYGRGLNHGLNAAGNDHVYELVVWRYVSTPSTSSGDAGAALSSAQGGEEVKSVHDDPESPPSGPPQLSPDETDGGRLSPRRGRAHGVKLAGGHRSNPSQRLCIEFMRHVILRGTIPVHWTSEIPSGLGEATMHFDPDTDNVTAGSVPYFQSVFRQLNSFAACDASNATPDVIQELCAAGVLDGRGGSAAGSQPQVALRCISLLRQSSNPGEEELSRHFVDAVRKAVSAFSTASRPPSKSLGTATPPPPDVAPLAPPSPSANAGTSLVNSQLFCANSSSGRLELAHVDWLNLVKQYHTEMAVGIFWQHAVPFLLELHGPPSPSSPTQMSPGMSPAISPRSRSPARFSSVSSAAEQFKMSPSHSPVVTAGTLTRSGVVSISSVQTNFIRVNCADSLDRTNLGCFFISLQVVMEMLKTMNVSLGSFVDQSPVKAASDSDSADDEDDKSGHSAAPAEALSLDESTMMDASPQRRASAVSQRSTNRFRPPFLRSWSEVRDPRRCPPAVVRALAEMFVANGDAVAMMYTNSAALHTNLMRKLAGMKPAKANAVISAQRRYENVFEDRKKFRHVEILLGRNIELHLPSLSPAYFVRPIPYAFWSSALVLTGVPRGATRSEIESALRDLWDQVVIPAATPRVKCGSSAICMRVFLEKVISDEEALDTEGFLVANSSVVFPAEGISEELLATECGADPEEESCKGKTTTSGAQVCAMEKSEGFCDVQSTDAVAVVEFDQDTCRIVDVVGLYLACVPGHSVTLPRYGGAVLEMHRYAFPIDREDGSSKSIAASASDAVKKAAHTLRSGFKSLVRGLN